jgi:hypothetical protein
MMRLGQIGGRHPDREIDMLSAHRRKTVAIGNKIARDQSEQIGGLWKGIIPFGPMHAVM